MSPKFHKKKSRTPLPYLEITPQKRLSFLGTSLNHKRGNLLMPTNPLVANPLVPVEHGTTKMVHPRVHRAVTSPSHDQ